jgi:UDPglucose--hexose-1-phosphate uridylyltransferase
MPELRFSSLRREWVAYAGERNERTFLPTSFCPLCASGPGGPSEVPLSHFEVVVFENRFPAFGPDLGADGRPVRPLTTGCEVVVYTSEHGATLADLPLERVRLLVEVWADRYLALGSRPEVAYVYIFENKGVEMGVTLHHPHGQIYAMPFVPPAAALELSSAADHLRRTGRCLHCEGADLEASGPRCVFLDGGMIAFVPPAARWPYEIHLYPRRHVTSIAELDGEERWSLSAALLRVARLYDRHFGFSAPYVMAVHQAPTDAVEHPEAHLHIEFYPPHRRPDRLKYLAGVELGAGTWVNDTYPESTAAELREADARV